VRRESNLEKLPSELHFGRRTVEWLKISSIGGWQPEFEFSFEAFFRDIAPTSLILVGLH
jgi:hypothetical protein